MVAPSQSKTQALVQTFNDVYFVKDTRQLKWMCKDLSERGEMGILWTLAGGRIRRKWIGGQPSQPVKYRFTIVYINIGKVFFIIKNLIWKNNHFKR